MIQEQVIITPINIIKAGQVKHFQIKLPKTAKRIIGIEIGGRLLVDGKSRVTIPPISTGATAFKRNALIGELKLQSCEEANIFYAGHLQSDKNLGYGDFTQNSFWKINPFTHQAMAHEEVVVVDAESTILQGVYKDKLGEQLDTNINYIVNVYVWYQR